MSKAVSSSRNLSYRIGALTTLATSMLLMQANIVMAAPVVTIIKNTAQVSFNINDQNGKLFSSSSNTVQVEVSTPIVYGLSLSQGVQKTISPGAIASWVNVLKNTSTDEATFNMSLVPDKTLSNIRVYQDLNNNGIIDESDREIILNNLTAQIKLQQAESIQFIVQVLISKDAQDGDTATIKLGVTIVEDPSVSAALATNSAVIVAPRIDFMDSEFSEFKQKTQVEEDVYVQVGYA